MPKVLIIQGAGMDQRGKNQIEIFGPQTLPEINAGIERTAADLGITVEIIQSNDETQVVSFLNDANAAHYSALIINPGGFTATDGDLPATIGEFDVPAYEVHASNPAARGVRSTILPVCDGAICGFGYAGYDLALKAIQNRMSA